METALQHPDIKASISAAPGDVGLSLVLYADREPYNAWGPHLCSFGCQANAVAGSTYYKLLVGRLLGYKNENVVAYANAMGGVVTPQTERQVRYSDVGMIMLELIMQAVCCPSHSTANPASG